MQLTPVLEREEYIEQAYFFRAFRDRLADGRPAQEILSHVRDELLSTTRLPFAVDFMLAELKHSGELSQALDAIPHYFTPFQSHVLGQAETDNSRFTFFQGLLILEREAEYRAATPTPPGLFIYQLETLSRNRLGYIEGLESMQQDAFYDEQWREYIHWLRSQLGLRDFAELVFVRSEAYVHQRRLVDPDYQPRGAVLFSEKEGRIAQANRGKDPMFLFATLQRQLGYPEVPRAPKVDPQADELADTVRKVKNLESRLSLLEAETRGQLDISKFYVKKEDL